MSIKTVNFKTNQQLSKHFSLKEFKCSASNTIKYSEETISMLEQIFDKCQNVKKGVITSGYRTPENSVAVGGYKDDAHVCGIAVDIVFYDNHDKVIPPQYISCIAQEIGFGGIGIMKNAVHLDTRHLGGYKNKKWYGDEVKNYSISANGKDFYGYCGLTQKQVYDYLGVVTVTAPAPSTKKTNEQIADEVVKGLWGNGEERKKKLADAGYDYSAIQPIVNAKLSGTTAPSKKSNEQVANEVLKGLWGNGSERKQRLTNAGYNYSVIQALVNKMCK